jgi:hypothetical protein
MIKNATSIKFVKAYNKELKAFEIERIAPDGRNIKETVAVGKNQPLFVFFKKGFGKITSDITSICKCELIKQGETNGVLL